MTRQSSNYINSSIPNPIDHNNYTHVPFATYAAAMLVTNIDMIGFKGMFARFVHQR
jgi:hypothetical protein